MVKLKIKNINYFNMKTIFIFLLFVGSGLVCNAQATFNSLTSGLWSTAATWTMTAGSDVNGIPDADDDVVILTTHTVTLNSSISYAKTLQIDNGAVFKGNSKKLGMKGDFTNNGAVQSTLYLYMQTSNATFSSSTTYTAAGQWYVQARCTLAVGTVINKTNGISIQNNNVGIVNMGSVTLKNTGGTNVSGSIACANSTNFWKNEAGSFLSIQANTSNLVPSKFTCSAATNTVTYAGTNPNIINTSFYDLNLTGTAARTLTTNLTVLNNLTISGGSLSSNATNNIKVGGALSCNGILSLGATDTLTFNGTTATTQVVSGSAVNSYANLVIDNTGGAGVQFNTNTNVTQDLFMRSGNCNGNNHLILVSDASTTARIATITNTAGVSFSGNTIVQKFINTMPAQYYDLSSPVSNTNVMDWDDEMYISGVGNYDGIGGPAGVDGASFNLAPTMHTYDEPSNTYVPLTATNTALQAGTGYNLLLADDPSITQWNTKTIDSKGTPNFGDITLAGLTYNVNQGGPDQPGGDGWQLVGNPYASHIDYTLVSKTRMTNNIYFTDNGNYSDYIATMGTTILAPYQGFYVETNPTALPKSITFTESCKVEGNYTTEFYRKKQNDIKLIVHSSVVPFNHEVSVNFDDNATLGYDLNLDASYRKFPKAIAPAIYLIDNETQKKMIRNTINNASYEVTMPLGIFTPKAGVYYVDVNVLNAVDYTTIWIENTKTGVKYDYTASVAFNGEELGTNNDFVLKMNKKKDASVASSISESNVMIFSTENTINLKSVNKDETVKEVSVYDMTGKILIKQSNLSVNTSSITKINISELPAGLYIVNTIDELGKVTNKKIIK